MKHRIYLSLLVSLVATNGAWAVDINKWGGGGYNLCGAHALGAGNACIGASPNCEQGNISSRDVGMDQLAMQMLVAMYANDNGAWFCPVQLETKNKDRSHAWTEYAQIGDSSHCFWLCKNGYGGKNCGTKIADATSTGCDAVLLTKDLYKGFGRVSSGANVENNIVRFNAGDNRKCADSGKNTREEHDGFLGIVNWVPSGHGAFVEPLIFRAQHWDYKKMNSKPTVYPYSGTRKTLLCKNGYKHNNAGTDCEPISVDRCNLNDACYGYSSDKFDESKMRLVHDTDKNCYVFRCAQNKYAFASKTDFTCAECINDMRDGVNPANGTCVHCDTGYIFDDTAADSGYCAKAMSYSKTDMMYGRGKMKSTAADSVKEQCWTGLLPDAILECIKTGVYQEDDDGTTPADADAATE